MIRDKADLVLRAGLAFAFLYPPIDAIFDPESWLSYFPHIIRASAESVGVPDMLLLHVFGLLEVVIALWVLSGWNIFWPSLAAAAMLLAIVVFDFSEFQITFRDLSIMAIAIALAFKHWPRAAVEAHGIS
jgi:uncharacterized membrane protein YphA (DoxX/SURF4 family)